MFLACTMDAPQWRNSTVATGMWWAVNSKAMALPTGEVDQVQLVAERKVRKDVS